MHLFFLAWLCFDRFYCSEINWLERACFFFLNVCSFALISPLNSTGTINHIFALIRAYCTFFSIIKAWCFGWLRCLCVCMYMNSACVCACSCNAVMNVTTYSLLGSLCICDLLIVVLCNYFAAVDLFFCSWLSLFLQFPLRLLDRSWGKNEFCIFLLQRFCSLRFKSMFDHVFGFIWCTMHVLYKQTHLMLQSNSFAILINIMTGVNRNLLTVKRPQVIYAWSFSLLSNWFSI